MMPTPSAKKPNPLFTVPVKYAAVAALLSIILFFVMLLLGKNPLVSNKYFDFLLLPIFIFICLKEFKKYHNHNILHFWQGMTAGFFTSLYTGLITALFIWGYVGFAQTELLHNFISTQTEVINSNKATFTEQFGEDTYRQMLADMQQVSVSDLALDDFFRKLMIGFFVATIMSVVLRQLPVVAKEPSR